MPTFEGYVNRLETQATPGYAPRHVSFLTKDEPGEDKEFQVDTYVHQLQTTLELAYATRRQVEVSFIDDGGSHLLTNVNIKRRPKAEILAEL
jgi:hypothetical protein